MRLAVPVRTVTVAVFAATFVVSSPGATMRAFARVLDRLTTSSGRPFAIAKPEVPGIESFAEIEPGLARGGRPTAAGIEYLRAQGYRTVVSFLDDADEREALKRAGIACVSIPLHAGPFSAAVPTPEERRRFFEAVSDSSRRPLFFHCKRGKDRTGAMAAILRIERDGWRASEAVQEMRAFGFSRHYKGLLNFVRGYRRGAGT